MVAELPADFPPEVLDRVEEAISSAAEARRAKAAMLALLEACEVHVEWMQITPDGQDSGAWLRYQRTNAKWDVWRYRSRLVLYLPHVDEPHDEPAPRYVTVRLPEEFTEEVRRG